MRSEVKHTIFLISAESLPIGNLDFFKSPVFSSGKWGEQGLLSHLNVVRIEMK